MSALAFGLGAECSIGASHKEDPPVCVLEQRPGGFTDRSLLHSASDGLVSAFRNFEVAICDLKDVECSMHLFAKRSDNRANDGGVLEPGDGEALLACVLQRRSNQVAFGAV